MTTMIPAQSTITQAASHLPERAWTMASRKQSGKQSSASGSAGEGAGSTKRNTPKDQQAARAGEQPEEEPLLAVILADSYNDHFAPLTLSWPRCLLPLANVPLLHYSIESATRAGVQHIYVLTRAHAQRIRQHVLESLHDILDGQGISITVVSTPEALSEGDALRELDAKQVIRADFLLFRADSVCTMDLRPVVERHRQRRSLDKDVIMTVCCKSASEELPMRSKAVGSVQYIDPTTSQVLHYETLYGHPKRKAIMPFEMLQLDDKNGAEEIEIRTDLVEAGVYVCSIDVPPLFSENFDYQSLQIDFIPGILTSDLLDCKIFLHVSKRGYGGRAQDTQAYHAISRDVLRRWTSPITPASGAWIGERMTERRGWRYVGQNVLSDKTSSVGQSSMIGSNCILGANTTLNGSILCDGVKVAAGSTIVDSHVHTSATIGAHVLMTMCIIGRGAKVLDNVTLGRGCLVGADCVVGPNVNLPDGSRVGIRGKEKWDDEEEEEEGEEEGVEGEAEAKESVQHSDDPAQHDQLLGNESRGVLWPNMWRKAAALQTRSGQECKSEDNSDDDDEEEEGEETLSNLCLRSIGYLDGRRHNVLDREDPGEGDAGSVSSIEYDSEFASDEDDDDDDAASDTARSLVSSTAYPQLRGLGSGSGGGVTNLTLAGEGDTQMEKEATDARVKEFEAEARASLTRALEENHSIDNASLELKTLRMASNVAPRDVQRVVVETLLERCRPNEPKQVQALISRWGALISQSSQEDEVQTLLMIQAYCVKHSTHMALFVPLVKLFYNEDVLSDECIVAWWRSRQSQLGGEKMTELRTRAQGVVRYILESGEEDESDDDGSE